jgi:hypothetical protein
VYFRDEEVVGVFVRFSKIQSEQSGFQIFNNTSTSGE